MSRFLQDLLQASEPTFSAALRRLESSTGHAGVDVQLIGEIIASAHRVMRTLGLDPADTTQTELYNALSAQAANENLLDDCRYIGLTFEGQVISFNVDDVKDNIGRPYAERTTRRMQCALQVELVSRYSNHARTNSDVVTAFARDAGLTVCYDNHNHKETQEINNSMTKPYILTIGDIVTDAFIKLREDQARIDTDPDGSKRLSMDFGSKPPYDHVDIVQAVGNSANAAVAFTRLGLDAGLMAWVGDDQPGEDSFTYLQGENVDTTSLTMAKGMKSNYHYALRYGADRTILIKYEPYNYQWTEPARVPDWLYLSMISEDSWQLHEDMLQYLEAHPETKLVFQPGTFHFQWGAEKLAGVYARSHLVVMNREEAALVTGKTTESIAELAASLHALGPKIAVITDGPDGAYISDSEQLLSMPNYPDPAAPYDRTGAGDAFASTIVAALALGESLETALSWAPINSMSVVQQLGAQAGLLNREELKVFLDNAPEDYHPTELV